MKTDSIVFSIVFSLGINYLYTTVHFLDRITSSGYQVENYYVVVLDNETYFKLEDLKNYKMGIYVSETDTYKQARKEIESKVKTKNIDYKDTLKLADDLLEEEVDAIFISEAHKGNLDEEVANFKNSTKILHTVSIKTKTKDIAKEVKVTEESFIPLASDAANASIASPIPNKTLVIHISHIFAPYNY